MRTFKIMRMPGSRALNRAAEHRFSSGYVSPPPKLVATVEAKDAETALVLFAEGELGPNYTCRETRSEQRYASAFLVARCWSGRNHHEVRWEAWRS